MLPPATLALIAHPSWRAGRFHDGLNLVRLVKVQIERCDFLSKTLLLLMVFLPWTLLIGLNAIFNVGDQQE